MYVYERNDKKAQVGGRNKIKLLLILNENIMNFSAFFSIFKKISQNC